MVNWWFGFLGFPYEWDSYLGPNRVQVVLYPTRSMELVYWRAWMADVYRFSCQYIIYIYIDPVGIAPQNVYRTLPFSGHVWKKMRGKTRNLIARCASQLKRMRADSTDRGRLDGRSDFQRWCSGRGISHTCRADSDLDGHANLMAQWKYCRWRGRRAATGPGQAPDRRSHAGGARAVAHEDSQRERGDRRYAAPDRTRVLREG